MQQIKLPGLNVSGEGKKKNLKKNIAPGTKFNRLTVIRSISQTKDRHIIYQCRCDCGNTVNVRDNNLHSGNTQSCGCLNQENRKDNGLSKAYDIEGKRFGNLIAVKENGKNKKGEIYWLFRCELCGRELSLLGRWVRRKPNSRRCDCGEKERKMIESKGLTKRVPRNNEQFAWDIYNMYIKEGWSVRDAATAEGYARGVNFTVLLMNHVPEYRENSIKRRNESKWAKTLESCKKKSKLFRYESDLQKTCLEKLKTRGVFYKENESNVTGFEIDILTNDYCYELKVTTPKKDIYRAIGQLEINAEKTGLTPVLVIPSDTTMAKSMMDVLDAKGIEVKTELTI